MPSITNQINQRQKIEYLIYHPEGILKENLSENEYLVNVRNQLKLQDYFIFSKDIQGGEQEIELIEDQTQIKQIASQKNEIFIILKSNVQQYQINKDNQLFQKIYLQTDTTLNHVRTIIKEFNDYVFLSIEQDIIDNQNEQNFTVHQISQHSIIQIRMQMQSYSQTNYNIHQAPKLITQKIVPKQSQETLIIFETIQQFNIDETKINHQIAKLLTYKDAVQLKKQQISVNHILGNKIKFPQERMVIDEHKIYEIIVQEIIQNNDQMTLLKIINSSQAPLFDLLKRKSRLNKFRKQLQRQSSRLEKISQDLNGILQKITDLDLICLLALSISKISQLSLGDWLVGSSYPIPLLIQRNVKQYSFLYCLASQVNEQMRPLVVQIGTNSTKGNGKTKLMLSILGECEENKQFYQSSQGFGYFYHNSILLYKHLYDKISFADINYDGTDTQFTLDKEFWSGVLTVFCFSPLKIIHVQLEKDFDDQGNPSKELKLLIQNFIFQASINDEFKKFIIIFRDYDKNHHLLKDMANIKLKSIYNHAFSGSIEVMNLSELDTLDYEYEISNINNYLKEQFNNLFQKYCQQQDLSQQNIFFYEEESLKFQGENNFSKKILNEQKNRKKENLINQLKFLQIQKQCVFNNIFPYQYKDIEIQNIKIQLQQLEENVYADENTFIFLKKIKQLKEEKQQQDFSKPIQLILELLLDEIKNSQIRQQEIEKILLQWKFQILNVQSNQKIQKQYELLNTVNQSQNVMQQRIREEINEIDQNIINFDISIEAICQEVISFYKNRKEEQNNNYNHRDVIKNILQNQLLSSKPLSLINGNTYQLGNSILSSILDNLDKNKSVFVISIIGYPSSGKSTLLNILFGSEFKCLFGQSTKGVNMTVMESQNQFIVLLDTEGLSYSIEGRENQFDNQLFQMIFAISNIILINNQLDMDNELQILLEKSIQALSVLKNIRRKPKIIFCIRDCDFNNPNIQFKCLNNILEKLNKLTFNTQIQINDLLDIGIKDICFLASAFQSPVDNDGKEEIILNQLFSDQVYKLRHQIIDFIQNQKNTYPYKSMMSFYQRSKQIWKIIKYKAANLTQSLDYLFQTILMQKTQETAQVFQDKLRQQFKIIYDQNQDLKLNKLIQLFNDHQNKFISIEGKKYFQEIIKDPQLGENKEYEKKGFLELSEQLKIFKIDQDSIYNKIKKSIVGQVQTQIKLLLNSNKILREEFDSKFEQTLQSKQQFNEQLDSNVSNIDSLIIKKIINELQKSSIMNYFQENTNFEFKELQFQQFIKNNETELNSILRLIDFRDSYWYTEKNKEWEGNFIFNTDRDRNYIFQELKLYIFDFSHYLEYSIHSIPQALQMIRQMSLQFIENIKKQTKIKQKEMSVDFFKIGLFFLFSKEKEREYKLIELGGKIFIDIHKIFKTNFYKKQKQEILIESELKVQAIDQNPQQSNQKAYQIRYKAHGSHDYSFPVNEINSQNVQGNIALKILNIVEHRRNIIINEFLNILKYLEAQIIAWNIENQNNQNMIDIKSLEKSFQQEQKLKTIMEEESYKFEEIQISGIQSFVEGFLQALAYQMFNIKQDYEDLNNHLISFLNFEIQNQINNLQISIA